MGQLAPGRYNQAVVAFAGACPVCSTNQQVFVLREDLLNVALDEANAGRLEGVFQGSGHLLGVGEVQARYYDQARLGGDDADCNVFNVWFLSAMDADETPCGQGAVEASKSAAGDDDSGRHAELCRGGVWSSEMVL